jgi:4-aminobutyrate aminotransferase-like enzyme
LIGSLSAPIAEGLSFGRLFPTTLRKQAPVVDIGLPVAGHYFGTGGGAGFDAYLGVGQRLIDEAHPRIVSMVQDLIASSTLLRRETATNDYLIADSQSGLVTPVMLADLITSEAEAAFPQRGPYLAYLSSSGAEAIEAGMKLACLDVHGRLIAKHGHEVEAELMQQLEILPNRDIDHPDDRLPLYETYPFFFITVRGAFHGRTFGALSLTSVRPVNKRGIPATARIKRIDFNGQTGELREMIDQRDLATILASPGGVRAVIAAGRIPKELIAGLVVEPFQGEAGYRLADRVWLKEVVDVCREASISVIADEIQSFARTGKTFACSHFDVEPDILALSKASVIGMTLASARYEAVTPLGWHSTTWGGGKVLDNTWAWTVLDTYLNYVDPVFGLGYRDNQRIKAEYIEAGFEWVQGRHPSTLIDFRGLGGMWGFSVRWRDELCRAAWAHGLKLLTCGVTEEISSIRALFLADVLTKEIDDFMALLDISLGDIEAAASSR